MVFVLQLPVFAWIFWEYWNEMNSYTVIARNMLIPCMFWHILMANDHCMDLNGVPVQTIYDIHIYTCSVPSYL